MALKYVRSGAGGAGTGADWNNAYTTLTLAFAGMALCLAINYGSRTELIDAVRSLAAEILGGGLRASVIGPFRKPEPFLEVLHA